MIIFRGVNRWPHNRHHCKFAQGSSDWLFHCAVVSTFGATCCYFLSKSIGKGIAQALWPARVEAFGKEVDKRRCDMFNYIVFLRLTPILPNTFINVASPVVRVPIGPFVTGKLIRLACFFALDAVKTSRNSLLNRHYH